jgi:integrase
MSDKKEMKVSDTLLKQLYNRERKEKFLKNYLEEDSTRTSYVIYLIMAKNAEERLGKDLVDFSRDEAISICAENFTDSHASLRAFYTVCKLYVSYAISEGYSKTMINAFELLKFKQHILPMLNILNLPKKFPTMEEIWEMENKSINHQDFLPIILSAHGIKGSRTSEIQKLKDEDISTVYNTLNLTDDDGSVRQVTISPRLMKIITLARGESIYKRRGAVGFGGRNSAELKDTSYVLRPTTVKGDDFLSAQSISSRTKKLLKDCGYENLSINDIYNAGKLARLKEIELEKGGKPLEVEDFQRVQFEFNDSVINYSNIMLLYEQINHKAE